MSPVDSPAVAWLVVAILAAIIEVSIPQFGVIFATLAAACAAVVAWLGGGIALQLTAFVVVLAASLALLRPLVMHRFLHAPGVPSRTDALGGLDGVVTMAIDATLGEGRVTVSGQDWAARCATALPVGTRVRVTGAEGIVLEVLPQ